MTVTKEERRASKKSSELRAPRKAEGLKNSWEGVGRASKAIGRTSGKEDGENNNKAQQGQ